MSKDGRAKGPVENEVEALRAMLEQRREREDTDVSASSETRTRNESSGEEPGVSEDEAGSGTNAEPATEESE